jgi:hypothetical protein
MPFHSSSALLTLLPFACLPLIIALIAVAVNANHHLLRSIHLLTRICCLFDGLDVE